MRRRGGRCFSWISNSLFTSTPRISYRNVWEKARARAAPRSLSASFRHCVRVKASRIRTSRWTSVSLALIHKQRERIPRAARHGGRCGDDKNQRRRVPRTHQKATPSHARGIRNVPIADCEKFQMRNAFNITPKSLEATQINRIRPLRRVKMVGWMGG